MRRTISSFLAGLAVCLFAVGLMLDLPKALAEDRKGKAVYRPALPDLAVDVKPVKSGLEVLNVLPIGLGEQMALQEGDIIREVNRAPVTSQLDLAKAIGKVADDGILRVTVSRGGKMVPMAGWVYSIPRDATAPLGHPNGLKLSPEDQKRLDALWPKDRPRPLFVPLPKKKAATPPRP
jgi:hypothetical protein